MTPDAQGRVLGIADLFDADGDQRTQTPQLSPLPEHWYWCRQHERAEHVNEPTIRAYKGWKACVRIGPFMSQVEAERLDAVVSGEWKTSGRDRPPLGMEAES